MPTQYSSVASWESGGNKHVNLTLGNRSWPYHRIIASLAIKYSSINARILDIGCGLGHTVSFIAHAEAREIHVAEAYQACLDAATEKVPSAKSYLIDEESFNVRDCIPGTFDVVIMSHVLEHMLSPVTALKDAMMLVKPGGVLIVAVPNVARPGVVLSNVFQRHYVNRGHVVSWDMSHWKNFLENIMHLNVVEYVNDYVRIGRYKWKIFEIAGTLLGKVIPWWCFSNIAVVRHPSSNLDVP